MSKQEFTDDLRSALSGRLSAAAVEENVKYYTEYIDTQLQNGKTEQEVLQELGNPRLIARTIVEANQSVSGEKKPDYFYQEENDKPAEHKKSYWATVLIAILILILCLFLVSTVLSFLAPILVPVILIFFLIKLFRDWLS